MKTRPTSDVIGIMGILGWLAVFVACSGTSNFSQNSTVSATSTNWSKPTNPITIEVPRASSAVPATSVPNVKTPSPPIPTMMPRPLYPEILRDDFIFSSSASDCTLPCWEGLTVGESNVNDVQGVFSTVLGFDERINILNLPLPDTRLVPPLVQDELAVVQIWSPSKDPGPYRELSFRFVKSTKTLQLITFVLSADFDLSPQRVIKELGPPIFVRAGFVEGQADVGSAYFQMVYIDGMVFYYSGSIPISYIGTDDRLDLEAEICMNDQLDFQIVSIVEPMQDILNLTSFQERALNDAVTIDAVLHPVEEVFEVTTERLVQRTMQESGACFSSRWPLQ